MVVPAPTFIKHTCVDTNVVLPMTTEVYTYTCRDMCVLQHIAIQEYQDYTTPHRLKCLSAGKVVVMVPLILYSDDTSGNRSKQWNKFDSWCLKLAGLPNEVNQQLHHIHHLCSSNKVYISLIFHQTYSTSFFSARSTVLKCSPSIVDELKILETEGIVAYDAHLNEEVLLVSPVLCITADNPRSSEIMNHLGPSSRMFCRMCMVMVFYCSILPFCLLG